MRTYGVIGSGSMMALAALARKPIYPGLAETIYRLLDAKFSSETARDVGRKSYVITTNSSGKFSAMSQNDINKIHEIWEERLKQLDPSDALDIIGKSKAVTAISDGEL
jgi:hypothetical protein